ncbi:MAG TPA: antibiotic biosynthesis monooxygenase [Polyangiaceae bacterium]|nr:antibiotic biosynthesis monooxygenase [Polyangiaceae bacterium]
MESPRPEATISPDQSVMTFINVWTTERPDELVAALEPIVELMARQPGFVSASVHVGLEGDRVAVYAQWRRREDWQAAGRLAELHALLQKAYAVGTEAPAVYRVTRTVLGAAR